MTAKTSSKRNAEPRRANKPLMEKRRRARINQSLAALKALILDSAKADNTKHSKLEKADILELTVRHFQRHRSLDTAGVHQYRSGYADCVKEVQRYLETPDAQTMTVIEPGVRQRLLRHLDNCIAEVDTDLKPPPCSPVLDERLQLPPDSSTPHEEVNNNAAAAASLQNAQPNVELPTKMVKTYDGNFVFVLPSHYLQLANALGINLRPQHEPEIVKEEVEELPTTPPSPPPPPTPTQPPQPQSPVVVDLIDNNDDDQHEKPLDYSKNNDDPHSNDSMWRPW